MGNRSRSRRWGRVGYYVDVIGFIPIISTFSVGPVRLLCALSGRVWCGIIDIVSKKQSKRYQRIGRFCRLQAQVALLECIPGLNVLPFLFVRFDRGRDPYQNTFRYCWLLSHRENKSPGLLGGPL